MEDDSDAEPRDASSRSIFWKRSTSSVTCYTSDDIGYITQQAGAGVLMISTDCRHQDMSVELDACLGNSHAILPQHG